eukprot:Gregarina_sp_Pseudo_9__1809@NODE_222_length_3540_cov_142_790917_g89_i1_p2_GENE_NODE_222_length_3540_cov_142_790917_g89_i1NODE_222_length_3540_cov_142_790917_g89_i1_p2_ORF_typecomplete_len242_score65_94_NODE_222_length_3540_cov_142_790917_g89_i110751800
MGGLLLFFLSVWCGGAVVYQDLLRDPSNPRECSKCAPITGSTTVDAVMACLAKAPPHCRYTVLSGGISVATTTCANTLGFTFGDFPTLLPGSAIVDMTLTGAAEATLDEPFSACEFSYLLSDTAQCQIVSSAGGQAVSAKAGVISLDLAALPSQAKFINFAPLGATAGCGSRFLKVKYVNAVAHFVLRGTGTTSLESLAPVPTPPPTNNRNSDNARSRLLFPGCCFLLVAALFGNSGSLTL